MSVAELPEITTSSGVSQPLLALSHVTLIYERTGAVPTHALEDVSLELRAGERVCVLGANGSGKTTLASVLCGLIAPDEGRVLLAGEDVLPDGRADLEAYRRARRKVGLVFQNPGDQIVTSVVADDVAFGPENLGVPASEIQQRIDREIARVALGDYAQADPRRLSGGQQQRVAIASTLAMEPRAIVFDEPGALLDVRGRAAIVRVMDRLRKLGVGIVHITHYMEEALGADRVVVLDHGHVALSGTPEEVFAQGEVLTNLGLEQPFVGRLAERMSACGLPVAWTCEADALVAQLSELAGGRGVLSAAGQENTAAALADGTQEVEGTQDKSVPTSILAARAVSFSYHGVGGRKALEDITLNIPAGRSVAIVGQTGSGKSTLLRLLCALDVPDAGEVLIAGQSTRVPARGRRARAARAQLRLHVGFVMQRPERQLFANTVEQDVGFGPANQGLSPEEVRERVDFALRICGLEDRRHASPFELSGGKQRLCAIAGILAMRPETIVLDEPMAGLDPHARAQLRALLADLHANGVTVVQVTHSMEDAARTEEVIVLNQSKLLAQGAPPEVFSREHADILRSNGLGLPLPLAWALRLEEVGVVAEGALGNPLTTDELVEGLVAYLKPEHLAGTSMQAKAAAKEVEHGA